MKDKKIKVVAANQFALNRSQVLKLSQLADQFEEVEWFTLEESRTSGIGPTVVVKFNLFKDNDKDTDVVVDITDVSTW